MKRVISALLAAVMVIGAAMPVKAGTETVQEPETALETTAEAEIEAELETELETEAETEAVSETETEAETEPEAEVVVETETETEPKTEAVSETETETEPETETEMDPELYIRSLRNAQAEADNARLEKLNYDALANAVNAADTYAVSSTNSALTITGYGIDVSEWQGTIDWNKVKNAGVTFAIIRVGLRYMQSGNLDTDSKYQEYIEGALAAGIKVGVYFFSQAISTDEAVEEAKYTINLIKNYNITYPIVFDYEGYLESRSRTYGKTAAERTSYANAFLSYVESHGYEGMMYGSASHLSDSSCWNISSLSKYPTWVAQYFYVKDTDNNGKKDTQAANFSEISGYTTEYSKSYCFWQFSSQGKMNGVQEDVDLDLQYTYTPAVKITSSSVKSATLVTGKTRRIVPNYTGTGTIKWTSSNTDIATVTSAGVVTGRKAGLVTITASASNYTAKCKLQVLYKDVTSSSKFWYKPVYWGTNNGIIEGYDNMTYFKPANQCTRSQMITFLWRMAGSPAPSGTKCVFSDVEKGTYYYDAVLWGTENGIIYGYDDGTFRPAGNCRRRQAITMIYRYADYMGVSTLYSCANPFSDVQEGTFYYDAVLWGVENGIVEGYDDGTFKPGGSCLRRQTVTFLYRYDQKF